MPIEPIPLMVELCAGTAALSLALERRGARPPVSRMGSKAGYSAAILSRLGLQPGQRARRYLWCDPDPGVRLLLHAYADRSLALAAADIIRGWADEEPRALWERLRAEGPVKGPEPREVARWGFPDTPTAILPTAEIDPREVARWLRIVSSNRLISLGPDWRNTGAGGSTFGGAEFCTDAAKVAEGAGALPQMPAAVVSGVVDPREVARLYLLHRWSFSERGPEKGYGGPGCPVVTDRATWTTEDRDRALGCERSAARLSALPAPAGGPVDCDGAQLPRGTVVYIDSPYFGTTGYADDIPRPEGDPYGWVRDTALRWAEAGATVCVSEAVPIPGLHDLPGWYAHEITGERKGQKRTFSKQKREWLTMNRRPAGQQSLWA